ncbi:hypothetical protein [Clostridium folliculivorans]|uniref:Zinc-finger domain-containing protein n=1 Tax=Clostridium folliculivorans TaxID=2886038 RepID=A0A9W5Y6E3_9CLOT|nr:hypothetical protein [Clostridium folliculivorans]GKU27395.1 hypothetical protein CFOLD11_42220 [Clostridium folliculivorans]GKU32246.1 hypothetical protein CFB3_43540 [Clostridium folliculivorans]
MDCQKFRNSIIDMLENQVSDDEKSSLEEHMNNCTNCKDYYDKMAHIKIGLFKEIENDQIQYSSRKESIMDSIDLNKYNRKSTKTINFIRINKNKFLISALSIVAIITLIVLTPSFSIYKFKNNSIKANKSIAIDKKDEAISNSYNIKSKSDALSGLIIEDEGKTASYIVKPIDAETQMSRHQEQNTTLIGVDKDKLVLYNGDILYASLDNKVQFYMKANEFDMSNNDKYLLSSTKKFILLPDSKHSNMYIVNIIKNRILKINIDISGASINAVWSSNDVYLCLQINKDIYLFNSDNEKISYVGNENNYSIRYVTDEGIIITSNNRLLPADRTVENIKPYKLFAYNSYIYALCYDNEKNTELYNYDYSNDKLVNIMNLGKREYTYDKSDNPFLITTKDKSNSGVIFNINTLQSYSYNSDINISGDFKNYISPSGNRYISKTGTDDGNQTFRIHTSRSKDVKEFYTNNSIGSFIDDDTLVYSIKGNEDDRVQFKIVKENLNGSEKKTILSY